MIDEDQIFRRTPVAAALDVQRDKIAECDRERGHILRVREGKISCTVCDAEWIDEGF